MTSLTIVTGASSNHFLSMKQLLASIQIFEPDTRVIIYDLGLTKSELMDVKGYEVRKFQFQNYPNYLNISINAGEYAWKPVIIADVMNEIQSNLFWLDAGCILTGYLVGVRDILQDIGLYTPTSSGRISHWTHHSTCLQLLVTDSTKNDFNRAGGVVAVNYHKDVARDIIQKWKCCALEKQIIAPKGANRNNHRQDQSILSVLVSQAMEQGLIRRIPNQYLSISIHNDIE
jgi:hypothetical protein